MTKDKKRIIEGIEGILKNYERNGSRGFITTIGNSDLYDTVFLNTNGEAFLHTSATGQSCHVSAETEGNLLDVFQYLDTNRHTLIGREALVEHEDASEHDWETEPTEVKSGDEVIGMFGIRRIKGVDEVYLAPTFLSPDGTYATLTLWVEGDKVGKLTAMRDMLAFMDDMHIFVRRLIDKTIQNEKDTEHDTITTLRGIAEKMQSGDNGSE